jgi:hypothetical protein
MEDTVHSDPHTDDGTLEVDLKHLTVEEIEAFEEKLDVPFDQAFHPTRPKGKVLRTLGWIIKRRDNPAFTWEDAGKLRIELSGGEVPPTDASDS